MDIKLNQLFSNKQLLLFKIIKVLENRFYDIQFEIDGLILKNKLNINIINGNCLHPDNIKYKPNPYLKVFYHHCEIETIKYDNKIIFKNNHPNLYITIIKNKWDNILFISYKTKEIKWNKEKCKQEALKYLSKSEFRKNCKSAYDSASTNGWLEEITNHLTSQQETWTIDKCYRLALTCNSRIEFSLKYPNAYDAALKRLKCLDEICEHMTNYDSINDLRIIYCYEFEDKSIYIGLTKDFETRERKRKNNLKDTVTQYINQTGLIPKVKFLTDFLEANLAQEKEQEFIDKYRNEGYNILNKVRGGSLGSNVKYK